MSTTLHAVFEVIFGNVYFVIVMFNNHGRKMRFSESSQNSISEKSNFGHFEFLFFYVQIFPRARVAFSCYYIQVKVIYQKNELSTWSLKKFSIFCKSTDFGRF